MIRIPFATLAFVTCLMVAAPFTGCRSAHYSQRGHAVVVEPGIGYETVAYEGGEAYVVESEQLARDLAEAEELQRREEARAAKLHAREMQRAEKVRRAEERRAARVALREQRRAEKLAIREARRAAKLRHRWVAQQMKSEARAPDGLIVAPPPMAPSLPSFPYATPRVEVGVAMVEAPFVEDATAEDALALTLFDAVNEQRAWRGLRPAAFDEALAALAQRYARLLAEAEVVEPSDDLMDALRGAEAELQGYAETAFLLDPGADFEPHAVIAWLADDSGDRDVVLADGVEALAVGVGEVEGARVVVFLAVTPTSFN